MIAPGDVPSPTIISLTNTPAIPPTQPLNPSNTSSDDDGAFPPSRFSLDPEKRDPRLSNREFDQSHPLFQDLAPEDSYHDGVYWADLPFNERRKWIDAQSNEETSRELKHIWQMFKKDPLSPLTTYCRTYVMGGFGLFTEGYALFSIGNLSALYKAVWPLCWKTHEVCSSNWIAAVSFIIVYADYDLQLTEKNRSTISKSLVSSWVRFLLVSRVTGSVVNLVLFKMRLS